MHGYRLGLLALATAALLSEGLRAETSDIEVYVGTRKVLPKPKAAPDPIAGPRAIAGLVSTVQSATGTALDSTSRIVTRMLDRAIPRWELPTVPVIVNVTVPPAPAPSPIVPTGAFQPVGLGGGAGTPGLLPWVKTNSTHELVPIRDEKPKDEPKPTVIVVRDHSALASMPESSGLRLSNELLLAIVAFFGVALIGTILAVAVRPSRSSRTVWGGKPTPLPVAAGHVAVGGCDAGPMPVAEKFDLGPSYAEELVQLKVTQKASEDAMLLNILDQNLTLRAELAE
jgi:hypothetical protein